MMADSSLAPGRRNSTNTASPIASAPDQPSSAAHNENSNDSHREDAQEAERPEKTHYGWRFWAIMLGMSVTSLISGMEGVILSTALPSITAELNSGENYIWIINSYFLTSAAVQPLYGQLANFFGRRWNMIGAVALFTLGSGICGGANSSNMLIAGRSVQGIGAGGINMLVDLIICDLAPLRERSQFIGLLFVVVSVGSALGPYIGGAIVGSTTWRWVFYFNLPFCGASLIVLFLFLHTNYDRESTSLGAKLKRIDYAGNAIVMGSTVAILFALTYGGTRYSWSSGNVIAPLVVGLVGLIAFYFYEGSKWCMEPVMPPRLFANRTSVIAYFVTFQHSIILFWLLYFFPVYFQAVQGSTPARSGVQLLPTVTVFAPFAAVAGGLVAKTGRYRPFHQVSFLAVTICTGCISLLGPDSNIPTWVFLQGILAAGLGCVVSTLLPAVQAGLPESEAASTSATWAFVRSLGTIWGVSIPAAIFNNRFDELIYAALPDNPGVIAQLANGQAYQRASAVFLDTFPPALRATIVNIYSQSLARSWQIAVIFAGTAFISTFLEKETVLRKQLDTEFGLEKRKQAQAAGEVENGGSRR